VVATAGHVDHGKSTLVKVLTGTDPDRLHEEQRRGLTIELGFAHTRLSDGSTVSFIDVPGHVRFIGNMLAGVGAVDACVLVVDTFEGWKPQTEEHLRILDLLGVGHGLVVLTKADLVDDEWRQLQELDVRDHLAGTFLADAPIVAVSATTGAGMAALRVALARLVAQTPPARDRGRPRLWVDRVFSATGSGTIVTGTLLDGTIHSDQHVTVGGLPARVRAIQSLGRNVDELAPGQRCALNLAGVEHHLIRRGDPVVVAEQWWHTRTVDAGLQVLESLDHVVSRRGAFAVHIGSGEWSARMRVLGAESLQPGDRGAVRVHLPVELPLLPGDRFVLREHGRDETVGGGEILDVAPVLPASRARPDRLTERVVAERGWVLVDDFERLTGQRQEPTVATWIVDPLALARTLDTVRAQVAGADALGLDLAVLDDRQRACLQQLAADGELRVDNGRAFPTDAADVLADHPFVAALRAGGVTPPDPEGVARDELRELQRRKLVVERDGLWFHPEAIDHTARVAAELLRDQPDGFTMSELRDRLGVSRKYALPLANELDARGITRRRGDLRIAGPRLPGPG
jgi:selenocysteine-specific elongation factor